MGFWSFLFSSKRIRTADEFFGEMLFMNFAPDFSKSYFECRRYFKPSAMIIDLTIDAQLSGSLQPQKEFFQLLENNYPLLVAKISPLIEAEFSAWMSWPLIKDFEREFEPVGLSIPDCKQQPIRWKINFDTPHDLNHMVTVVMIDFEPQYVRIDG